MNFLLYLINNVLSQPIFIIGLVVILGMLAEKKSWDKILPSTIKAIIGFTMINIGGQTLGGFYIGYLSVACMGVVCE